MYKKHWIFNHNWAIRISTCCILCKNIIDSNSKRQKYQIVFAFIGGDKYIVEFLDKKVRDQHFRFIIRMMEQNYRSTGWYYAHWILHILSLCLIVCLCTILFLLK